VSNSYKIIFIILISYSFLRDNTPFELVGHVKTEEGIVLPNIYIQVLKNGDVINQTKTDNFGNFILPLSKLGVFSIKVGIKNKYFLPTIIKKYDFHSIKRFKKDFNLKIDKQILQRETTKLKESYNHMIKNQKNLSYKRAFFNQFPESGYETELFFNKSIPYQNLKKEAKTYFYILFNRQIVGRSSYMNKFIRYGQKTNMSVAGPITKKFYNEASIMIKEYPLELFKELNTCKDKTTRTFFLWMFSGNKFGQKVPDPIFNFLSIKFNKEFVIMHEAFDAYINGD